MTIHRPYEKKPKTSGEKSLPPLPKQLRSKSQGVVRDDRGQTEPADKERAQETSSRKQHGETDPPIHPKPKE